MDVYPVSYPIRELLDGQFLPCNSFPSSPILDTVSIRAILAV